MGRHQSKAADLASVLGGKTTTGQFGAVPAGDIVVLAVLYASVVPVVAQFGDALAGKVIVDITNPFDAGDGLTTRDGSSPAQEVAVATSPSASPFPAKAKHSRADDNWTCQIASARSAGPSGRA
jgi:predicted dinucleotide-binding enzyme